MKLTKEAEELKLIREQDKKVPKKLERLATCMGSDDFGYALFDGGYLKPEEWVEGDDLIKLKEAIKLVDEFKNIVSELHEII